ncbi:acyl-CoA dehydrogenase [Nitratireductor aestuarii]|uniref:Acyl-CoA dehydrogenase n=1 Tax=Nitratireductor aestuarii TaxID=1735103 RepID=A0A916RR69_9HYPH|nr:acyl-CoA dehydrogenase family protein [Nitratireductor aestuarii]GGA66471.1 acyl-CoA dehydrogenase [Nitratireductor aestuarii]
MDFQLTHEQKMLQESIKKMVDRDINPILRAHDPDKPLTREATRQILDICQPFGFTGLRLPEEAGGVGVNALTFGLMKEMLPPVVSFICGGQETTAVRIYYGGTPEQRERYIPAILKGDKLGSTGSTEPNSGSDPRAIRTRAIRDGDHMVINGQKVWASNAAICDFMLVIANASEDPKGPSKLIRIIADKEDAPFVTRKTPTLGFKQGNLGEAFFDNYRAPIRNVVGGEDDASAQKVMHQTWLVQRPMMGLLAVNMAQKALDSAVQYSRERVMFGRKIGGFQLVQQLLSEISTAVTTSRLLCYYALDCIDKDINANQLSAMAKRYSIAACQKAISLAMEVHGAMGISTELGLEELYRDVRMLPIPDGTNQILTLIEGRELTGISAIR